MSLEQSLHAVEQLVEKVSAALLAAEPAALEKHSTDLRNAAAQLSHALDQQSGRRLPISAPLKKRIAAVSAMLVVHRESLARLSAITDRQAAVLLPPSDVVPTYGDGRGVRPQSAGLARIYRSTS